MVAATAPDGVRPEAVADLGPDATPKLRLLEDAGLVEQRSDGSWSLVTVNSAEARNVGACAVLPTGDTIRGTLSERIGETVRTGLRLFMQLNGYLLLAVVIAGAIKVLFPTSLVTAWVGGTALNSVLVAAVVALLAYVCTYVEVPTALALVSRGMGPGATLAYLLGGPGLSLPSIAMLSGVFRPKVLMLYVGASFAGSVAAGYVFNSIQSVHVIPTESKP